jgi:hypothetical protein
MTNGHPSVLTSARAPIPRTEPSDMQICQVIAKKQRAKLEVLDNLEVLEALIDEARA